MGTRGLIAYVADGELKAQYNQYDMYPSGKGVDMLRWLRGAKDDPIVLDQVKGLTVVDEQDEPTAKQREALVKFGDAGVSNGRDWYSTLRNCQGDPALTLASGFITGSPEFAKDSLFCEWAYVIDLDTRTFEVYRGFVKEPHTDGRFASGEPREGYYPVRLVASYPFDALPTDDDLLSIEKEVYGED